MGQAGDKLDHALAFLEVVDDGRGRHAQDVQIGIAFGGEGGECRDELPPLGNVFRALLGIVDFVHDDEVDGFARRQGPDALGRVRLLERLVIQDQIAMNAVVRRRATNPGQRSWSRRCCPERCRGWRAASPRQRCSGNR